MKRSLRKRLTAMVLAGTVALTLAACGEKETQTESSNPSTETGKSDKPIDFKAKYDPPITLTAWRFLHNTIKFREGQDIENNIYMDYYREEFGINLKYSWVVPEEQWVQRMNIAVASGDLPDIMWLDNKNLIELANNDLLYDLTDLYKQGTSDFTKSILEQDTTSFNTAKVDGKLMAIPHTSSAIDQLQFLFIRTDWLNNLGLKMPTNMQELSDVMNAFKNNDPDKNGKNDTFGLALTKTFLKDLHFGATGFFAAYHGYAQRWIEDKSGNIVYGSIQPEVKTGLLELQKMYKGGLLDKEFSIKDRTKVTESVASGKVGIVYGGMSSPLSLFKDNILNDPKADWMPIPLVSSDDKVAKPITKMPVNRYYAVSKKCKYPEAIIKLTEAGSEGYSRDNKEASKWELGVSSDGIANYLYEILGYEPAKKNLTAHYNILDAIAKNDTSYLNVEEKGYYDKIMQFRTGKSREFWTNERVFGSPSTFDVMDKYVNSEDYLYDKFYGSLTPTMVERKATLDAMEEEVFTKIIMGEDISAFDKFVSDWKKLGGDQITKEVNEWYQKSK